MSSDQFVVVARQLEKALSELNQLRDPALRRSMLSHIRLLIVEADRLVGDETAGERDPDRFGQMTVDTVVHPEST
jgi:hypothetical protein